MKNSILIICALFNSLCSFSQALSKRVDFEQQNLALEIKRLDYNKMQYAHLFNLNDGILLNTFALSNEPDLNYVRATSFNDRKLVVIAARSTFYILNIDTSEISGPFTPIYRRELGDAQDLIVKEFQFIEKGKYLVYYAVGDKYQVDLSNPSSPKEILKTEIDNAWVRDAPSNGNVIMKLPIGSICEVLAIDNVQTIREEYDHWYKIKYNSQVGYIFGAQTSIKHKR